MRYNDIENDFLNKYISIYILSYTCIYIYIYIYVQYNYNQIFSLKGKIWNPNLNSKSGFAKFGPYFPTVSHWHQLKRKNCVQQLCSHQCRNWPWAPQCYPMLRVMTRSVESAGYADASKSKGWRWWFRKHLGGGIEATWWSMFRNQLSFWLIYINIFPSFLGARSS